MDRPERGGCARAAVIWRELFRFPLLAVTLGCVSTLVITFMIAAGQFGAEPMCGTTSPLAAGL